MQKVLNGLDILLSTDQEQKKLAGDIGYLGNQASVNKNLVNGLDLVAGFFGKRLIKAFGPQHGFSTVVQDNMIETPHEVHPLYNIPIYSLYSETRIPSDQMLENINTLVVDLQDVGTRVYTYIWTLYHIMEVLENRDIRLVILDRPNPVGGMAVQGNLPEEDYYSFVCRSKIPMRHGMTIGEVARWFHKLHFPDVSLHVIKMQGWERQMYWKDTGLPWINPSPNLPTPESSIVYPGSVLFEGTTLSEGRGTTRSLELIGHPEIDAYNWKTELDIFLNQNNCEGQVLRPVFFEPVYHKFKGQTCGGFHIHPVENETFNPWKTGQLLISFLYNKMNRETFWNKLPYEYEYSGRAIDWINGTGNIRALIEKNSLAEQLDEIESRGRDEYMALREECLIYR